MSDDGCFPVLWTVLMVGLVIFAVRDCNSERHWRQWKECRTLITTSDSASVLRAKPECARWTWPAKENTR